jgi:hypothetical protein
LITSLFCTSRSATCTSASVGLLLASQIAAVLDIREVEIDVLYARAELDTASELRRDTTSPTECPSRIAVSTA